MGDNPAYIYLIFEIQSFRRKKSDWRSSGGRYHSIISLLFWWGLQQFNLFHSSFCSGCWLKCWFVGAKNSQRGQRFQMNKKYTDKFQVEFVSSKSHNVFFLKLFSFHSLKARGQHCFRIHSKTTSLTVARSFALIKVFVLACSLTKLSYLPKTSLYKVPFIGQF